MSHCVFDIIAKDPEEQHVASDVHETCMHKHRSQKSQIDYRWPRRLQYPDNMISDDLGARADQIRSSYYLFWYYAKACNERVTLGKLKQKHKNIDRNQSPRHIRCD